MMKATDLWPLGVAHPYSFRQTHPYRIQPTQHSERLQTAVLPPDESWPQILVCLLAFDTNRLEDTDE